jgi:hypothetical protein
VFPAAGLSVDPERRHHAHEKSLQRAMKRAVEDAGICKPVSGHTLRHSFVAFRLRHPYRTGNARACRCINDDDLQACAEQRRARGDFAAGCDLICSLIYQQGSRVKCPSFPTLGTPSAMSSFALPLGWLPVWRRNFLVWKKLALPSILGNLADPLIYMLGLGYGLGAMLPTLDGQPYVAFLAAGTVCASTMNAATFEALYSAFSRMHVQKTWDAILNTPLGLSRRGGR